MHKLITPPPVIQIVTFL